MNLAGGACGYRCDVSLFGGPSSVRGCGQKKPPGDARSASPSVALPRGGSATELTKTDENGALAQYGPAVIFGGRAGGGPDAPVPPSGPIRVSTKGKRSVTSSASVKSLVSGPFTASSVRSTCTASKSGATGSTTITKGVLATATDQDGTPTATETLPSHPPANYTLTGVNNVGDQFKAVFNEQKIDADGRIEVIAVHLYLLGPSAVGEVVIAESHARA